MYMCGRQLLLNPVTPHIVLKFCIEVVEFSHSVTANMVSCNCMHNSNIAMVITDTLLNIY